MISSDVVARAVQLRTDDLRTDAPVYLTKPPGYSGATLTDVPVFGGRNGELPFPAVLVSRELAPRSN